MTCAILELFGCTGSRSQGNNLVINLHPTLVKVSDMDTDPDTHTVQDETKNIIPEQNPVSQP